METATTAIEGKITFKVLRDYILDRTLTEHDTVLLNSANFDDIVLEHRRTYQEGIIIPFYFLRVLIKEDPEKRTALNKINFLKDDPGRYEGDFDPKIRKELEFQSLDLRDRTIHLCGWCGNVVDHDGSEFSLIVRLHKINILKKFKGRIAQKEVEGMCCANEDNDR
jgi:hypothetical protein